MKKEILSITGMTCSSCANAIEKSVIKIDGVRSANVNFATEKLNVEYDEGIADIQTVKQAVKKAGYTAQKTNDETLREIAIPISGMTCASCANTIEKSIKKLNGINEVNVNFATEKANVVYDS